MAKPKPAKKKAAAPPKKKPAKAPKAKPAPKAAAKKAVKKPAPAAQKADKKAAPKKVAPKKSAPKSAPKSGKATKTAPDAPASGFRSPPFPIRGSARPVVPTAEANGKASKRKLSPKILEKQLKKLLDLRDHILDQMHDVAHESLRSANSDAPASAFGMHQADAGSDAYEKDFALSLLSQEQDALYEIEEALKRLENSTYGVCEMSGHVIPLERLEAIPFARYTVECQSQFEREQKGRNRWETSPQFMENADNFFEEEEDSSDDEDRPKLKE